MPKYNHQKVEKKWQKAWAEAGVYTAEDGSAKPKFYCLVEFPYPSGDGLHVGHVRSYTAMDIISRTKRMAGYNVLYPIGWDAFGLPTENFAIKTGEHPIKVTKRNVATYKKQIQSLGISFDWDREINTTDPNYYHWTQWIFLKLFERGLAYKSKMPINWCPKCKIGLANEEAEDGKCERCGSETEKREIEQWMLKITAYADRLIEDLETVDYLEKIKTQQINWIGRSVGAEVKFAIEGIDHSVTVFTTRPDTLYGATFLVLSPEHELVNKIVTPKQEKIVIKYQEEARHKTDLERTELQKEKTGVFTGAYAVNPVSGEKLPIWIADYVLSSYGTGAIMAVPAHDERDFAFAKQYGLKIKFVVTDTTFSVPISVDGSQWKTYEGGKFDEKDLETNDFLEKRLVDIDKAYTSVGYCIKSGFITGLQTEEASMKMIEWLEKNKKGKKAVNYHLRDWVFSRQHYWGEPIPMVHCDICDWVPLAEKDLPLVLPMVEKYEPTTTGESPLAAITDWVNTTCPKCGGKARRETDTMPNWAGSSWYSLRYADPKNMSSLGDMDKLKYWMPVDLYNGGMEHTTLHLLYSRFWNKFLYDIGAVPTSEPYMKRISHGMILAPDGQKMSKSRGNVINPDEIVSEYGADVLRVYEMFMGPYDQPVSWDLNGVKGVSRFIDKLVQFDNWVTKDIDKVVALLHKTIKKVTEDIEERRFNTAVSTMMIFVNEIQASGCTKETYKTFLILLSPFAPHVAEELNANLGGETMICLSAWPKYNESLTIDSEVELVIQVNGKVRAKLMVSPDVTESEITKLALADETVQKFLNGATPKKIIFVKGKLLSLVV